MNYSQYKTDKERADIAPYVPPQYYIMLMDWWEQATDKECRVVLQHYAQRAFHIDTE